MRRARPTPGSIESLCLTCLLWAALGFSSAHSHLRTSATVLANARRNPDSGARASALGLTRTLFPHLSRSNSTDTQSRAAVRLAGTSGSARGPLPRAISLRQFFPRLTTRVAAWHGYPRYGRPGYVLWRGAARHPDPSPVRAAGYSVRVPSARFRCLA